MPYWHRIGTNCVRTEPPIATVHVDFFCSDVVRVVLVRQFVHLTTYFFTATQFNHVLAELVVADEPIVNAQEFSLLAFILELIRDVVLVIPFFLPVAVTVGSTFPDVVLVNRKEVKN